ncbi:MAG: TonB-dependent receptor domain-containing protein [Symbiopectobacterium sp.]
MTECFDVDVLLDKNKQDLYLTKRTYVPEIEYTNYSPFLQEYALLDNVTLHAGVRHEIARLKVDDYRTQSADANGVHDGVAVKGGTPKFNQALYNVGIVYSPLESLSLFANYSEEFGMPDVGRALRDIDTESVDLSRVNNVKSVVTKNIETGFQVQHGAVDFEAAISVPARNWGIPLRLTAMTISFPSARKPACNGLRSEAVIRLTSSIKSIRAA